MCVQICCGASTANAEIQTANEFIHFHMSVGGTDHKTCLVSCACSHARRRASLRQSTVPPRGRCSSSRQPRHRPRLRPPPFTRSPRRRPPRAPGRPTASTRARYGIYLFLNHLNVAQTMMQDLCNKYFCLEYPSLESKTSANSRFLHLRVLFCGKFTFAFPKEFCLYLINSHGAPCRRTLWRHRTRPLARSAIR